MALFDEEKINSHFNISVTAVSCSRKGKYDAEVQICDSSIFDNCVYKQVLVSSGHATSTAARKAAAIEADHIRKIMWSHAIDYMKKYPDAQP